MGGGAGLLACSCTAGNGVHAYIAGDESHLGGRQEAQLDTSSKTSGVGHVLCLADLLAVELRQTVDIVVVGSREAEILRQVDDLHVRGNGMLFQEGLALAVSEAEKHYVDLVEGHIAGEAQVGLAIQPFVYVGQQVAGIALAVHEADGGLRMVQQQADKFACRVAGTS